MTTLKLDGDHDIAIENNSAVLIRGGDEVVQRLRCNLKAFLGEWFLDQGVGTPWLQIIFDKTSSPEVIAAAIKTVILNTPGVIELKTYDQSINASDRTLAVTFDVISTDGEIFFSEDITP